MVCLFSQTSPRARHPTPPHPTHPRLSNVLLIYTCWAQGCIGMCSALTASITPQALLLPFKIHLKRLAGATVQPSMDATILMCYREECWLETAGNLCALSFFFLSATELKCKKHLFKLVKSFEKKFENERMASGGWGGITESQGCAAASRHMLLSSQVSPVIDTVSLIPLQFSPKIESCQKRP